MSLSFLFDSLVSRVYFLSIFIVQRIFEIHKDARNGHTENFKLV